MEEAQLRKNALDVTVIDTAMVDMAENSNVFTLETEAFDEAGLRAKLDQIGPNYSQETKDYVVQLCREEWYQHRFGGRSLCSERVHQAIEKILADAVKKDTRVVDKTQSERSDRRRGRAKQRQANFTETIGRTTPKERKELSRALKKGKLKLR